jgi:copper chaperone CopZ
MEKLSLAIRGMSCGHCVKSVDQALKALPGVEVERVEVGSATVAYDPAQIQPEQIEAAVSEEGYQANRVETRA